MKMDRDRLASAAMLALIAVALIFAPVATAHGASGGAGASDSGMRHIGGGVGWNYWTPGWEGLGSTWRGGACYSNCLAQGYDPGYCAQICP